SRKQTRTLGIATPPIARPRRDEPSLPPSPERMTSRRASSAIGSVEPDGEGAVVDELNRHLGSERPGLDVRDAVLPETVREAQVETFGGVRRRGVGEAGPAAARCVRVERELAHDQRGAADVE